MDADDYQPQGVREYLERCDLLKFKRDALEQRQRAERAEAKAEVYRLALVAYTQDARSVRLVEFSRPDLWPDEQLKLEALSA